MSAAVTGLFAVRPDSGSEETVGDAGVKLLVTRQVLLFSQPKPSPSLSLSALVQEARASGTMGCSVSTGAESVGLIVRAGGEDAFIV